MLEVLACLAKDFGILYEEATLCPAYAQCQRTPHSSGRDYLGALTRAQRNMQAADIALTLRPASSVTACANWTFPPCSGRRRWPR